MELNKDIYPYLRDEKFSNGLFLTIAAPEKELPNRIDFICNYCRDKKVIHVGCLDHLPLIERKIQTNLWLHKRIDEVAKKQVGIDINLEGLKFVKEKLGYTNVFFEDIVNTAEPGDHIREDHWDVMVLGEILEHVNDPINFLENLKRKYSPFVNQVLFSVPNAFAYENFRLTLKHQECINSDHRSWFSVFTLSKALSIAGFGNFDHHFVLSTPEDFKNSRLHRIMLKKYPSLRSTIMMLADFKTQP
jgi:SAM-dependent methyltransferase